MSEETRNYNHCMFCKKRLQDKQFPPICLRCAITGKDATLKGLGAVAGVLALVGGAAAAVNKIQSDDDE